MQKAEPHDRLGEGTALLGEGVCLGEGAARLGEGAMPLQDHPRVHLGEPNLRLGEGVHLGKACLFRGEGRIYQMKTNVFAKAKDGGLDQQT